MEPQHGSGDSEPSRLTAEELFKRLGELLSDQPPATAGKQTLEEYLDEQIEAEERRPERPGSGPKRGNRE